MKKSLIALAAVAASGAAMAQSSVTLFGVVDTSVAYTNGANNWNGLATSGNSSSRIGFRGTEDLGGGLKANFWLEAGILPDTGSGNSAFSKWESSNDGLSFKRRSTIGLEGGFGEVRLGRELTAAYNATSRYDVFGTVGFGSSRLWNDGAVTNTQGSIEDTNLRVGNMITYLSPNFSGFKFGLNYGFGEKAGDSRAQRYVGGALTYDNGPLSLGLGMERRNRGGVNVAGNPTANPAVDPVVSTKDVTAWSLGGSYNFGVVKLAGAYRDVKAKPVAGASDKLKGYYFGLSAPVGAAGEVKASYNRLQGQVAGAARKAKADQFALGYVHSLSKRTAVYGTYSYVKNKSVATTGNNLISLGNGGAKASGKQHGIQVGVRHSF